MVNVDIASELVDAGDQNKNKLLKHLKQDNKVTLAAPDEVNTRGVCDNVDFVFALRRVDEDNDDVRVNDEVEMKFDVIENDCVVDNAVV